MYNQIASVSLNKLVLKSTEDKSQIYRLIFNRSLQLFCPPGHALIPSQSELPLKSSMDYRLGEELLSEYSNDMENIVSECLNIYENLKNMPLQHVDILCSDDGKHVLFRGKHVGFRPLPFLFLDIDGTLLFGCKNEIIGYEHRLIIGKSKIYIKLRPYLREFLDKARKKFNLILYTAGKSEYAESVANILGGNFDLVLSRRHCQETMFFYLKDIRILNVDLKQAFIIDNERRAFSVTPENGIMIKDFYGNPHDQELLKMMNVLDELANTEDVRTVIAKLPIKKL